MNIVNSNGIYQIYGDSVEVSYKLEPLTYKVGFSENRGFFLVKKPALEVSEKIYGRTYQKVDKIINTFAHTDRNLGVLLTGQKGSGKSLMSKQIAQKANENSMPVIIVDEYFFGVSDFIGSIDQEVIVLFDEFEKIYSKAKGHQDELLPLFDGYEQGKKLFVIIANDSNKLSRYILNRPGRFHYHFSFCGVTNEEIKDYLKDKLDEKVYDSVIHRIIELSFLLGENITYDILRAITIDLNLGYSLDETLSDLNIAFDRANYELTVILEDGLKSESTHFDLGFNGQKVKKSIDFKDEKSGVQIEYVVSFPLSGFREVEGGDCEYELDGSKATMVPYYPIDEENDTPEELSLEKRIAKAKIRSIILKRVYNHARVMPVNLLG